MGTLMENNRRSTPLRHAEVKVVAIIEPLLGGLDAPLSCTRCKEPITEVHLLFVIVHRGEEIENPTAHSCIVTFDLDLIALVVVREHLCDEFVGFNHPIRVIVTSFKSFVDYGHEFLVVKIVPVKGGCRRLSHLPRVSKLFLEDVSLVFTAAIVYECPLPWQHGPGTIILVSNESQGYDVVAYEAMISKPAKARINGIVNLILRSAEQTKARTVLISICVCVWDLGCQKMVD